jgi:hypothetical protein
VGAEKLQHLKNKEINHFFSVFDTYYVENFCVKDNKARADQQYWLEVNWTTEVTYVAS